MSRRLYDFVDGNGNTREFYVSADTHQVEASGRVWVKSPTQQFSVPRGTKQPGQAEEVLAGYRRQEEQHGSRFRSRYSAQTIKENWARP